jgi:hypothetical protein
MALPDSISEARTEQSADPDKITEPNHNSKKNIRKRLEDVRYATGCIKVCTPPN